MTARAEGGATGSRKHKAIMAYIEKGAQGETYLIYADGEHQNNNQVLY